ncbi:deoxyribodipyrimidine photo-lyase, partial [Burkholderia cenocepacia]
MQRSRDNTRLLLLSPSRCLPVSAKPSVAPAIVWFRDDLRVTDQPALTRAVESGRPLV